MASTRNLKVVITGDARQLGPKRQGWVVRYVKRANRWVRRG